MVDTLLMDRVLKAFVGRVTIMRHAARPVDADDFFQDIGTALRVDGVERGSVVTDPAVEPDGVPTDAPARFVRSQMGGDDDAFAYLLVHGLEDGAGSQDHLGTSAGGHGDAVEFMESVGNLAMGHAGTLVEINDGGLRVR